MAASRKTQKRQDPAQGLDLPATQQACSWEELDPSAQCPLTLTWWTHLLPLLSRLWSGLPAGRGITERPHLLDMHFWHFPWPVHKVAICSAHPSSGRAEEQTLEHRQCLRQPPPSEASRQGQLAFSQSYHPSPTWTWTLTISTKKIHEVKFHI